MIKKGKILTGGNISEHYPLGADNSALYSWAATFLKNLDLKDRSYSRYFAVPETNKTGSRIDWYCNGAYYQGDPLIVPWENADEPERTAALKELDGMMDGLAKMAERLRSKPGLSADMKLFVQFIAGDPEKGTGPMALETPGKKFIYIVEGHPVLTFWGFTESMIGGLKAGIGEFFENEVPQNPLKSEYLLPRTVDKLIKAGEARVKVLPCHDKWCGVTYKEDWQSVHDELQSKKDKGDYPEKLWK